MSLIGILVGALVALVVYFVGTAITSFAHESLVWGVIAIILWIVIATQWVGFNLRR